MVRSPAEFAFGSSGCPPIVGSDTAIDFEITLLRFEHPTEAERRKEAMELQQKQRHHHQQHYHKQQQTAKATEMR